MSRIHAGELKHKLLIGQETSAPDGQGGFSTTWATLGDPWAKAKESTPSSRFYRGEDQHTQGVTFTIRQKQPFALDTRLSDKYRITHRGQYFRVLGISQNQYDTDFYDIACELWGATTA